MKNNKNLIITLVVVVMASLILLKDFTPSMADYVKTGPVISINR